MQRRWTLLALAASLRLVPAASGLAEFGSQGMDLISTPGNATPGRPAHRVGQRPPAGG
ncbi:hypothetical protein [Xanthomonas sp. 3075]|uniref:hypothetical protein n=1 Tax=Xanthomonas sp. 3075 TaxID=3035315 RepID=UPI00160C48AD|nr:hypothetical protein [Xanthomonas sp. 3075]MBB4129764.1 hypothetical protein [Xanthomonas sp. 3075]